MITTFQLFVAIVVLRCIFDNTAMSSPDYWANKKWTELVGNSNWAFRDDMDSFYDTGRAYKSHIRSNNQVRR